MEVIIKEVVNKKMLKDFVKFGNELYKDNKYYVPVMIGDEINNFDKVKNVNYKFTDGILFLAYQNDKIVGRICGIINYRYNELKQVKHVRYNTLDFIDDLEVSKALLDAVCKWGKEKGMDTLNGPLGITDCDRQGMLIEGFEQPGMYITYYNFPYYENHMNKYGLIKDVDWNEYLIEVPKEEDKQIQRIKKVSEFTKRKMGFKLVKPSKKDIDRWIDPLFKIYNEAFAPLHGVTKLEQDQIDMYVKNYFSIINFDYISIVTNDKDELIGFALLVPSLTKVMQETRGKLFPFGFLKMMNALNNPERLDMFWVAVGDEYQGLGVNAILMMDIIEKCQKNGVKFAETGPELEENFKVQSMWTNFNAQKIRKRRCYIKKI